MFYTIYKTINIINDKEYVGFHTIKSLDEILGETSENGSLFCDGYLGSGKLMKMALQKYGPLNMRQELILITTDKNEAADLEKEIVCAQWVASDKNYNLSIGGNVTILFGEDNGFFGKKHTIETVEKMQQKRKKTFEQTPFSWSESFLVANSAITFLNNDQIKEYFKIDDWFEINKLVYSGAIRFKSEYLQKAAIQRYLKRYNFLNNQSARCDAKEKLAKLCSERFLGVCKTSESNEKRSVSIKAWIDANPEQHQQRMLQINKNLEKIKKTAAAHTGMRRSEKTKHKISQSKKGKPSPNKGKICIYNTETSERKYVDKGAPIPAQWAPGRGQFK